jgi:hypothetical protein
MINSSVGEYDVRECWAYDYTDPMIQSMLFLNFGEHVGFFRDVMKNFEIKRVIMFPFLRNPLNFIYFKKLKPHFCVFILQIIHERLRTALGKTILETVWGKCQLCSDEVGEVRVFGEEGGGNDLKKIISTYDNVSFAQSSGDGCVIFKNHLNCFHRM